MHDKYVNSDVTNTVKPTTNEASLYDN